MAQQEEWRLCVAWLVECGILSNDHKVSHEGAEVFDLAQVLRDGVLICHLLNRLHPGAIDPKDFSQRPQMSQFLCLKNIRIFLQTCKNLFGLRDMDMFDPYDLFDVKDFGKVIYTLSKLSKSAAAQVHGPSGFPKSSASHINKNNNNYKTLEELATDEVPDDDIYDTVSANQDEQNQEIYEDLCSLQRKSEQLHQGIELKSQRDYCINELVETERNYKQALEMMVTHFIRPLRSSLQPAEHQTVFACIEDLHRIHDGFHSVLTKACYRTNHNSSQMTIADCFVKYKDDFLIYGEFCSNLPKAQEMIDELLKRPQTREKINECQKNANDGKFRLRDLLSVPMQRVLKYHLLLNELIKQTDKADRERNCLERALEEMKDLSWYVNEVKRDNEALQLMYEIQDSIVDLEMPLNTTLKDYGKLLKDGEIKVRSHDDNRQRNRHIFLFDQVMLMCKARGDQYSYKNALVLSKFQVDRGGDRTQRAARWSFQFLLVPKEGGCAYTLVAKTEEMRTKWIDAIKMALENTCPPGAMDGNHKFVMFTFNSPTYCDVCRKLLRGVFHQGYKCQKTNVVVHKECIQKARDRTSAKPDLPPGRRMSAQGQQLPGLPERRSVIGKVKANNDYIGHPPPDRGRTALAFELNDVIELLNKDEPTWWEGRTLGKEGFFPASYVTLIRSTHPPSYDQAQECMPVSPLRVCKPTMAVAPMVSPQTAGAQFFPMGMTQPGGAQLFPPVQSPSVNSCSSRSSSYVNLSDLDNFTWFTGEMGREVAAQKLEHMANGVFLIRESTTSTRRGQYALSIRYANSIKHIKLEMTPQNEYFLADCKVFHTIPELVQYYQQHSLHHSFPEVQTALLTGYKDAVKGNMFGSCLGYCIALYDYSATQVNQLSLRVGDRIEIVSKVGGDRGWWKGRLDKKTGYFPCGYVEEE